MEKEIKSNEIKCIRKIKGDFEELKNLIYLKPSITLILGPRNSGKTALGLNLLETSTIKNGREAWVIQYKKPFPSWIKQSPFIEKVPNDSNCFCDEGWLTLSILPGSTNKKQRLLNGIISTALQKSLNFKLVVQNTTYISPTTTRYVEVLFIKEPTLFQTEERPHLKEYFKKAKINFMKLSEKERKEYSYVVSDLFEGIVKNELPSFWNMSINSDFRKS
jgi:hypothetical protein